MAKPEPEPRKDQGDAPRARPRTIEEALARLTDSRLVGQKMKQEGGVKRHLEISSFDTKATLSGVYDYALIQAVQSRWFALLDERDYTSESRGKVVLTFVLHYDGRVTDVTMVENTTSTVLGWICRKAIEDPAPFDPFPKELRHEAGDTRHIQFTFYYQ